MTNHQSSDEAAKFMKCWLPSSTATTISCKTQTKISFKWNYGTNVEIEKFLNVYKFF